jgi:hypothetical protein
MTNDIDKAEQQLLGFTHAKQGYSLIDLISSMGLKKDEWETLNANYELTYLSDDDIEEINEYFKKKSPK